MTEFEFETECDAPLPKAEPTAETQAALRALLETDLHPYDRRRVTQCLGDYQLDDRAESNALELLAELGG